MLYSFAVPSATQAHLQSQVNGWASCRNLSLLLHQYVPREVIMGGGPEKGTWLAELAKRSRPQESGSPLFDPSLHQAWLQRWMTLTDAHRAIRFQAHCAWRMVVGLGGQSPAETDLLVHPIYGIPYVPGSALKGLAHAYVLLESESRSEGEAASAAERGTRPAEVERIFGTQEQSGSVVFFDAVPASGGLQLDVDVMNPHYPEYYRDAMGSHPPSDDQNPIPVHFLTVAAQSVFHFAVAPRGGVGSRADAERVCVWLKQALHDYGVGAKTSAGYGRFEFPDSGG